jgi:hypothetical protein
MEMNEERNRRMADLDRCGFPERCHIFRVQIACRIRAAIRYFGFTCVCNVCLLFDCPIFGGG